ncbi:MULTISPECIES: hypothetical protein [unclassified Pseudomonas]|uniref:hypothetical protein n=1 Tax=unclassified Pseudomonas TaxID=196821 RepID=UPI003FA1A27B
MAKKSRFYRIKTRNGYGHLGDWIVPARTKLHAENYFRTADIAAYYSKHMGHVVVDIYPDTSRGVIFYATINEQLFQFEQGDVGYEWLKELFLSQYNVAEQDLMEDLD